ncbi:MAG: hypothetical protein IPJ19_19070 [Planctomycetes bacterium]|nr:hypothetical protein [Planctomycetota bacterium]
MRADVLALIDTHKDTGLLAAVHPLLLDSNDDVREKALRCVRDLASKDSAPALFEAAQKEEDEYPKVEFGEALLELGDLRGVPPILAVITDGEAEQARKDAWEHLRAHLPIPAGLEKGSAGELRKWWTDNQGKLTSDHAGVFKLAP